MSASAPFVDDSLMTDGSDGPALVGSTCTSCGTTTFPRQGSCPRCTGEAMVDDVLPRRGTLWSWTVQRFRPAAPYLGTDDFAPYGVGYVELGGRVLVEGRLSVSEPERLRIGMPVEVVLDELGSGDDRRTVFGFRPLEDA